MSITEYIGTLHWLINLCIRDYKLQ